jgi:hypothetical protein
MVVDTIELCIYVIAAILHTRHVLKLAANVTISVVAEMSNGMVHYTQI